MTIERVQVQYDDFMLPQRASAGGPRPARTCRGAYARAKIGKPGFPVPPPAGGSGRALPSQENSVIPCGCGPEARAPGPRPTGGSGRAAPSQEQPVFIPSGCGGAAWRA